MLSRLPLWVALSGLGGCVFITPQDRLSHTDADGDGVAADRDCDDRARDRAPGLVEICDGIDNDCNGLVDDGLFPDLDGDGQGGEAEGDCFVDWIPVSGDCDDSRVDVFVGQVEQCNGRNDSCADGWSPARELGLVSWTDGAEVVDLTAAFAAGADGSPAQPDLPAHGVLSICRSAEAHRVRLWADDVDNLAIVGVSIDPGDGSDPRPLLNGASIHEGGPVIAVSGGSITLADLRVTGGNATSVRGGGGLHLSALDAASLSRVAVVGNQASEGTVGGAGIYLGDVLRAELADVAVTDNLAGEDVPGGGLMVVSSTVRMVDGEVARNRAGGHGGGFHLQDSELRVRHTPVVDNVGLRFGGGLYSDRDSQSFFELCPFQGNSAGYGGAVASAGAFTTFGTDTDDTVVGLWHDNHAFEAGGAFAALSDQGVSFHDTRVTASWLEPTGERMRDAIRHHHPVGVQHDGDPLDDVLLQVSVANFLCTVDRCEGPVDKWYR